MIRFLRNFELDRLSFWLGFIAGILLLWLLRRMRPWVARLIQSLRERSQLTKLGTATVTEIRMRNDLLRYTQSLHLAAPLFSLDEITLTPRLLVPPALTEPGVPPPPLDITEKIFPHLPDAPVPQTRQDCAVASWLPRVHREVTPRPPQTLPPSSLPTCPSRKESC